MSVIRAIGLACLAVTPSALIFGYITWSYTELWYFIVALHCVALICATVLFLLPQEKQWRFIRGLAELGIRTSKNPGPQSYELLTKLDELERQETQGQGDTAKERHGDVWGARRVEDGRGEDGQGEDGQGDTEKGRHGDV